MKNIEKYPNTKVTNCQHLDFSYETYDGEKRVYCAKRGSVPRSQCRSNACKDCKRKGIK